MEKFSNDFLTVGIAAPPLRQMLWTKLLTPLAVYLQNFNEKTTYSLSTLFVCFFPFLSLFLRLLFHLTYSIGKFPIVCIRCVHFIHSRIHYHPLLVYSNFSPVAFGATPFLHDIFYFVFIAVSVRASVIRPFVVNFIRDLYLISDRKWRDPMRAIVRPTLFGKCIRIEVKWRQSTKSGYKTLAAHSLRVAQAEWIRLCAFHRLSHFDTFFFFSVWQWVGGVLLAHQSEVENVK